MRTPLTGSPRIKKATFGIWEKIQKSTRMEKSQAPKVLGKLELMAQRRELIWADPQVGDRYRQEWYLGHAEDAG